MSTATDNGAAPPAPIRARALGRARDLDIDFGAPRPWVVTQVLARCASAADSRAVTEEDVWRWTLPRRTQALLSVARACGAESVAALAHCGRDGCGGRTELELELASLAPEAAPEFFPWQGDTGRIMLRLPTGDDQRRWLDEPQADAAELSLRMASSLVCEVDGAAREGAWQLPERWLPGVEDALAEHDPLTALSVAVTCSGCGGELAAEIDLEALLLGELARAQRELLADVHALASAYHWSETQILRLPAGRRRRYLAALRAEA